MKVSSELWSSTFDSLFFIEQMDGLIVAVLKQWQELGVQHSLKVPRNNALPYPIN